MPHLDDAYALAKWLTANASDAEDVVQDACIRALRALDTGSVERPKAWLLAIVRNTAFTWLAKNRPASVLVGSDPANCGMVPATDADPSPTPEETLIAAADRQAVQAAIAGLPQAFREALVMRDINGLSYREIAEITQAPIGTVMSRLARARTMLMTSLAASQERSA